MKTYPIVLYPGYEITILLYKDVLNTKDIMTELLKGQLEWAIINCKPIINHQQLLLAATKAVATLATGKLTTNNIHTELIFRLSPNTNIRESLKNFGLQNEDKEFYIVLFNGKQEKFDQIKSMVQGEQIDQSSHSLDTLNPFFDKELSRKLYGINDKELKATNEDIDLLKNSIFNTMAIKGLL
ncbi:hypothetical protein CYY_002373 [Polysphondylium violaceum]|uniref:EKC/KEOPS complex subunit cgi121 n=1 Tax=Polysphondylium violaceum TaxID=133409 RepID=A0A8J4Q1D5_9MYCE|nr:hypothetical protein CYY_002373 [Polysphondylium violaceum]